MFAMRRQAHTYSREIAEIERLLRQLEARAGRLTDIGMNSAASGANQLASTVSQAFSDLADSFRSRYGNASASSMANDAARAGQQAWRRVTHEAEHHPMITLAVAIGVGYLAGMLGRRN